MTQVIIVDTQSSKSACEQALDMARAAGSENTIIIAESAPAGLTSNEKFIGKSDQLGALLQSCLPTQSQCVIVNAQVAQVTPNASAIITEMLRSGDTEFRYEAVRVEGASITFAEAQVEELSSYLASMPTVPTAIYAFPTSALTSETLESCQTLAEVGARLFVQAISSGLEVKQGSFQIVTSKDAGSAITHTLSKAESARALRFAVTTCNIEELFPNHAWEQHGEESASASYHTLASLFLRLDDLDTASQCLTNGDRFEDSPRSLALQGMIALRKGEMLGAVAKMITSLQEYENRKRNNGSHYLTFNPGNFEGINASLTAGLAALNKRDNGEAVKHFSKAIFEFDPFYRDMGLQS